MSGELRVNVKRDRYDMYLGRNPAMHAIPLSKSLQAFANPYSIGKDGGRKQVVEMYEVYIRERINHDSRMKDELFKLRGKRLACWCGPDQECHVDIVIKLINEYFP